MIELVNKEILKAIKNTVSLSKSRERHVNEKERNERYEINLH